MGKEEYIFVARAINLDGSEYENAFATFDEAQQFLNEVAEENEWEQEAIGNMSIVRFAVDNVFKPNLKVIKRISFVGQDLK